MGWSWEAWGWVRVGVGQVLTKVLQVLAKGFPIFYLEGVSYEGRCWTKKFEIWPGPGNPKNVPTGPRRPPGPPKNYKKSFGAPGPLGPFWARGPSGPTGPSLYKPGPLGPLLWPQEKWWQQKFRGTDVLGRPHRGSAEPGELMQPAS